MAVKKFPQDLSDITNTATKLLAANSDGTNGFVTRPSFGENMTSVTNRGAGTPNSLFLTGNSVPSGRPESRCVYIEQITTGSGVIESYDFGTTSVNPLSINPNGGRVGIRVLNPTAELDVNGNIKASGSVSGTVFNPTSLRERKRDIYTYDGDALSQINALELHTYHFREYETIEESPATYENVIGDNGEVEKRLITPAVMKDVEKANINQMLNVGVIIDEVDNDLIADQERGVLNLNNIVFLLAKSVQQLSERLDAIESK